MSSNSREWSPRSPDDNAPIAMPVTFRVVSYPDPDDPRTIHFCAIMPHPVPDLSLRWDYGDGFEPIDIPAEESAVHTYPTAGRYHVGVSATEQLSGYSVGTESVVVDIEPVAAV